MVESLVMPEKLPASPNPGGSKLSSLVARLKSFFLSAESRLSQMSRRRLVIVVMGLALGFILLGVLFGVIFTPYSPTGTPSLDSSAANHDEPVVSYTGVVGSLDEPKEGADYYLGLESGKRYLLKSLAIDISFFKGASVTAEGILVPTSDGSDEILFVSKIRIK